MPRVRPIRGLQAAIRSNLFSMCRCELASPGALPNSCSFCRYKTASHLHILQPLKVSQFLQMRADRAYLFHFLQMQKGGRGDIPQLEPNVRSLKWPPPSLFLLVPPRSSVIIRHCIHNFFRMNGCTLPFSKSFRMNGCINTRGEGGRGSRSFGTACARLQFAIASETTETLNSSSAFLAVIRSAHSPLATSHSLLVMRHLGHHRML